MYNGKHETQKKTVKIDLKKYLKNKKKVSVDLPYYGQWKMKGTLYKKSRKVKTYKEKAVNVSASEYNIVMFRTTTPVLVTTLKLLGDDTYTKSAKGEVIPTIVGLGRYKQYNWSKLPDNWYRNPVEYKYASKTLARRMTEMTKYVRNLHKASPDAVFHIYINDYHLQQLASVTYGAGIPDDRYTVTMVTDGSATYNYFRNAYADKEDAQAYHELLKKDYQRYRNSVLRGNKGTLNYDKDPVRPFRSYSYAVLEVEDANCLGASWWVVRKSADTFAVKDQNFQQKVLADARISSNYINNLLLDVQRVKNPDYDPKDPSSSKYLIDETTKEFVVNPMEKVFRDLYNFDDSAIKASIDAGRKPMMILGSSRTVETADPVSHFIRFTKKYYGDEYDYFYKGHPGFITEDDPVRMAAMESMGVRVLDSSIAAELFIYYNPEMYMSGYQTSTFQNAGAADKKCGLFNIRKAPAIAKTDLVYAPDMDLFITSLAKVDPDADARDAAIKALAKDTADDLYLVEFSDEITEKTGESIAIWNDTKQTAEFYSEEGGAFKLVRKL